jgi:3-dehydroquinate dehydratase-1
MSMRDLGKVTRVAGELIGSVLSFASLEQASAPGQIPIDTMDEFIKAMQID